MIKRLVKRILLGLAVVGLGIQFVRPERTNPAVDPARTIETHLQVPEDVASILHRACRDCHTHETVWPWYSQVAPVSWLLVRDVNEGRKHFNMSDWGAYTKARMGRKLSQISEVMEEKAMPLPIYVTMHPQAVLSDEDRKTLSRWAEKEADKIGEDEEISEH